MNDLQKQLNHLNYEHPYISKYNYFSSYISCSRGEAVVVKTSGELMNSLAIMYLILMTALLVNASRFKEKI